MDDEECYSSSDSSSEEEVEVPATDTANGNAGAAASSVVKDSRLTRNQRPSLLKK
uniref:Uncharacterized protein n=1 Tax=Brassica campestris TaxID=3711 RepID=A0A3P6ALH3_BRACM|nr:unnamed protein product [Brassica rapa]